MEEMEEEGNYGKRIGEESEGFEFERERETKGLFVSKLWIYDSHSKFGLNEFHHHHHYYYYYYLFKYYTKRNEGRVSNYVH